jgi:ribosomal protein S18 acetylase RimI-like enzyme
MRETTIIRAFDGSLADAEGLLAVEKATFDESPYDAETVRTMLTGGSQRAWLAIADDRVVGFVVAFPTFGLGGSSWEIDLLAVHPKWTGRGLATRLVRTAANRGMDVARHVRAAVATDNAASARAFVRAGFRRVDTCELLICRPKERSPYSWTALDVTIRETDRIEEAANWLPEETRFIALKGAASHQTWGGMTLLLAESSGRPAGYAELVEVQTLLYRGVWIESLVASRQIVRAALVHEALKRAIVAGLDELGVMAPYSDRLTEEALLEAGFRSLGAFDWYRADLPLPGLARAGD